MTRMRTAQAMSPTPPRNEPSRIGNASAGTPSPTRYWYGSRRVEPPPDTTSAPSYDPARGRLPVNDTENVFDCPGDKVRLLGVNCKFAFASVSRCCLEIVKVAEAPLELVTL